MNAPDMHALGRLSHLLTPEEIAHYHECGYVIPGWRLPAHRLQRLRAKRDPTKQDARWLGWLDPRGHAQGAGYDYQALSRLVRESGWLGAPDGAMPRLILARA